MPENKRKGIISTLFPGFSSRIQAEREEGELDRELRRLQIEEARRKVEVDKPEFSIFNLPQNRELTEEAKKNISDIFGVASGAPSKTAGIGDVTSRQFDAPKLTRSEFIQRALPKTSTTTKPSSTLGAKSSGFADDATIKEIFGENVSPDFDPSIGQLKLKQKSNQREETRKLKEEIRKQAALDKERRITRQKTERLENQFLKFGKEVDTDPILKEFKKQEINLGAVSQLVDIVSSGNTVAFSALGTKMARGMGEVGVLTEQDIKRYVNSGRLDRKAADTLSQWILGRATTATLAEIKQISDVLKDSFSRGGQPRINAKLKRFSRVTGIPLQEVSDKLAIPFVPTLTDVLERKDIPQALKVKAAILRDKGILEAEILSADDFQQFLGGSDGNFR